jgi:hypothetical protein
MSQILRQSTQIIVVIGPFVDVTDGFTPETGITLGAADEAELLKSNTTTTTDISAATWAPITGCDGWYGLTLSTTHTDTIGPLTVMVHDDSVCLPVFARFQVIEEAAYDTIFAASALPASTTNITAGTITTATNVTTVNGLAANVITATAINTGAITAAKFAAGAIDAAAIATGAIDADALAADASAEIADAVWDEDATAHQTGGTFGQAIGDPGADTNTIYKAVVTDATGATVGVDVAAVLDDTGAAGVVVAAGSKTGYSLVATTGLGNHLSGSVGSVTGAVGSVTAGVTVTTNNDKTGYRLSATGVDDVWEEPTAGHVTAGTTGVALTDILTDTAEIGAAGAGLTNINLPDQTMNITGNITGNLSGSVGSVTGLTASDVTAIKAKTDSLTYTVAGQVDANIQYVNDVAVTGNGQPGTEWGP